MRQMKTMILVGLLGLLAAAPVSAGGLFFGAKTGPMIIDSPAVKTDATNVGVLVGYELGVGVGDLSIEGELTTSTSDGELKTTGRKFDVDTMAAYLAFRTAGPIYLKAKGGFMHVDVDNSDTGVAYGIGVGFGIGIAQLELEYTQGSFDPDDVAFVSVGVQF